jgi:hypothetical protein
MGDGRRRVCRAVGGPEFGGAGVEVSLNTGEVTDRCEPSPPPASAGLG